MTESSTNKRTLAQVYEDELAQTTSVVTSSTPTEPTEPKRFKNESVEAFDRFYEENKDKIKMPADRTYPRNEETIRVVHEELTALGGCDALLGRLLTVGLNHISFAQFYQALSQNAYEAVAICERENRKIQLYVFGRVSKSNFWCTLLIWPIIRNHVVKITSEGTYSSEGWAPIDNAPHNTMLLVVDDAMYSGQQMVSATRQTRAKGIGNKYGKDGKLVYCVLVAAASSAAIAVIKDDAPLATIIGEEKALIKIKTVEEIGRDILTPAELEEAKRCVKSEDGFFAKKSQFRFRHFDSTLTMTYMDHKMPDNYSINNVAIAYAPTPHGERMQLHNLIQGCVMKDIPTTGVVGRAYKLSDKSAQACPPSFIKSIEYTIKGSRATFLRAANSVDGQVEDVINQYKQ